MRVRYPFIVAEEYTYYNIFTPSNNSTAYWLSTFMFIIGYDFWQLLASICNDNPTAIARCENFISHSLSLHLYRTTQPLSRWLRVFPPNCSSSNSRSLTHSDQQEEKESFWLLLGFISALINLCVINTLISSASRMVCTVQDMLTLLH